MPLPRFEVPAGVIDGVNTVFTVSTAYTPGTTAVFLNGLLLEKSRDDGWTETNPASGVVTLKEPPRVTKVTPDVVQIFFIDTSPAVLEARIVERLRGRLTDTGGLEGRLIFPGLLRASLEPSEGLEGHLRAEEPLYGELAGLETLHGRLEAVC